MSDSTDGRLRELELKQERQITLLEGIVERNKVADKTFADHIEHEEPYHQRVATIMTKFNTLAAVFSILFILAQVIVGSYLAEINLRIKDNMNVGVANSRGMIRHEAVAKQDGIYFARTLEEVKELIKEAHNK